MIRVTADDQLADCLLTPRLRAFTRRFPAVQVETIITDRRLDISRDEADYGLALITREEMRNLPHVRAFDDFIASRTPALRHMIEGRAANG